MPPPRSDADRRQAIDSMFRIRAVESPPDASGQRTVWHRGAKGCELVSWVNTEGLVTRQELSLFEDVVLWQKGTGFSTGETAPVVGSKAYKPSDVLSLDAAGRARDERLVRVHGAVRIYSGSDKFIAHFRDLLQHDFKGTDLGIAMPVTKPDLGRSVDPAAGDGTKEQTLKWLIVAFAALVAAAAIVALLHH